MNNPVYIYIMVAEAGVLLGDEKRFIVHGVVWWRHDVQRRSHAVREYNEHTEFNWRCGFCKLRLLLLTTEFIWTWGYDLPTLWWYLFWLVSHQFGTYQVMNESFLVQPPDTEHTSHTVIKIERDYVVYADEMPTSQGLTSRAPAYLIYRSMIN